MMMDHLILAERDLDSWIQIIMVILVFGGTALGAISKKLIEYFGPKKEDDAKGKTPPRPIPRGKKPMSPPRAKPIVDVEEREVILEPQRVPAPPVARPAKPVPPPVEIHARPAPRPVVVSSSEPSRPRGQLRNEEGRPRRSPGRLRHLEPTVDDHIDPLHSRVEEHAELFEETVEEHLGHLKPRVAAAGRTGSRRPRDTMFGPMTGLDRSALRRAVILREILGPPVALRSQDDRY